MLLVTASSSAKGWKDSKVEAEARATAASLRVVSAIPTQLRREESADYRFGRTSGPSNMKSRNDDPNY